MPSMPYRLCSRRVIVPLAVVSCLAAAVAAGPLSAAEFKYPIGVAATKDGTVYVADRNLPGIWKIADGKATVFFQASKKFRTPLNAVRCVAIDEKGNLLAGDSATREVYRFDKEGKPAPLMRGTDQKENVGIGIPMAIAVDKEGTLFVADLETQRIWKVPGSGGEPQEFAQVVGPRGLAFDAEGRLWATSQGGKNQLVRISPEGKVEPAVEGTPFQFAHNVVLDKEGVAFVADGYAKTIWKIGADGKPEKWVSGEPLKNPVGLAWRGETLLIADGQAAAVFAAGPDGELEPFVSGKPE